MMDTTEEFSVLSAYLEQLKCSMINQTSVPTAANLTKKWNCAITVEAFKVYRRNLFYLMMCEITDLSNFEYFYYILLGYISGGETLF